MADDAPVDGTRDGGFWLRLSACVLDQAILALATGFVGAALVPLVVSADRRAVVPNLLFLSLAALQWLYHAGFESGRAQATPGKRVLGLRVGDERGERIGFRRASARWFAKLLSTLPFLLGFAWIGFTRRKRGFHDLVAGTRVVATGGQVRNVLAVVPLVAVAGVAWLLGDSFTRIERHRTRVLAIRRLEEIGEAERRVLAETGGYFAFAAPAGRPGKEARAWSPEERAAALAVGWDPQERTYFSYRVVTARSRSGKPAWAACAEADLDGDGEVQAIVAFGPADEEEDVPFAPPAPCENGPRLERPAAYEGGSPGPRLVTRSSVH
jgi:uncharacterized RDD family membrane protein YckC